MAKTKIYITDKPLKPSEIASSMLGKTVEVSNKKSGAPFIIGEDKAISVSHKKNFTVVGISTEKVGVDIEFIEDKDTVFKIAKKYFGEKIEEGDFESFYRSWTKKEALGKVTEKGITKSLLGLDTSEKIFVDKNGAPLYFNHFFFDGYIVTVADYMNDVEFMLEKK